MLDIVQISPRFPPDVSGVGDFAARIAERRFCSCTATLSAVHERETLANVVQLAARTPVALVKALGSADRVFLHFSGYGYDERGLCRWLVDGLERWHGDARDRRLVTFFHEVYATGPIWRSSFWTAPVQRRLAARLGHLSSAGFVSSHGGGAQLRALVPDLPLEVLPVFSNIGESQTPLPIGKRSGSAIVFGGISRRTKVYSAVSEHADATHALFNALDVTEVIDVGPQIEGPASVAGRPVRALGVLAAEEIAEVLGQVRIGLVDYPGHVITKSGVAAAYFAHGLLVVNTSQIGGYPDGLRDGETFLTLQSRDGLTGTFDSVAAAGHAWYRPHCVAATVARLKQSFA